MRVTHVTISRFRRFADEVTVRLDGSVIALVGPNEAGKTSFLEALKRLDDDEPFDSDDPTRDVAGALPSVSMSLELDEADRESLSHISGGDSVHSCVLHKTSSGPIRVELDPYPPNDLGPRKRLDLRAREIQSNAILKLAHSNSRMSYQHTLLRDLQKWLRSDDDVLSAGFFSKVQTVLSATKQAESSLDEEKAQHEQLNGFIDDLEKLDSHEAHPPSRMCGEVLLARRPRLLSFEDEERNLQSSYDLDLVAEDPPSPLKNLAALGGLDLAELHAKIHEGSLPQAYRLCEQASAKLAEVFAASWVREDVVPVLNTDNSELHVFVRTPGGDDLSRFDERSDGFRWFVALVAFVSGQPPRSSKPVLLVDEAETHLSYDAQANLAATLATQDVAQLVIYTTHSAGCLPPDLGTGIRAVVPEESGERSSIKNGFWHEGPGYTPLMLAMGANALAFTPARRVVVGEGASECILLPTLLREATGADQLDFQVAPGLSNITAKAMRDVLSMAGEVAYLVDGDDAGRDLRNQLVKLGFPEDRIVSYTDVGRLKVTLEDLVHPRTFAQAVELEAQRWQGAEVTLDPSELPQLSRMHWLNTWCEQKGLQPLNKPTLAQRVVDMRDSHRLVAPKHRERLQKLVGKLENALDI